ncbi:unnamed protein product [Leptidea sinapis]|uniref:Uncharacterized protein n=1 Tax=Leptidea sinapis TaxID=189913 RepID=A0A5E4QP26_9NEOP|nr:unnamed protein product [Leptidea sinapis]
MDNHKCIKQEDAEHDIQDWTADWQLGMMPQGKSDCDVSVNQLFTKQLRVKLVRLKNNDDDAVHHTQGREQHMSF